MPKYNPADIEPRWQQYWAENSTFSTPRLPQGKKVYVLDMFPYPSGDGLHVGHPEGYTATDIMCRYHRMLGHDVMHPMGFDAFGLPAEEHAIKTGTQPRVQTNTNMETFRRQLKMLGFSYDWDRELATIDNDYFRWTQWIFLQLFDTWFDAESQTGRPIAELRIPESVREAGPDAVRTYQDERRLAYQAKAPVNWCPALGTVLANEEVVDGRSERGSHPVIRRPLRQWMLRITEYADRLEQGLDQLDWPESIKSLQRNWIGRSEGAEVDFFVGDSAGYEGWKSDRANAGFPEKPDQDSVRIYTTRPDTLFGATYMVLAPEHPFVERLTTSDNKDHVEQYRATAAAKSDLERTELSKEKTGVFTGSYATNPANDERIPIWIADYVLATYGTGAIMAVPAHDTRDFEFAVEFKLSIIAVVDPADDHDVDRDALMAGSICVVADGTAVNSGKYDGTPTSEFKQKITSDLQEIGLGRAAVNYKLRDWLFSRQRFWGEPFPVLHELDENGEPTGRLRTVEQDQLPVDLPELADFRPHGRPEPPLDKAPDSWLYPVIDGVKYKRETNTMPQWAGSCWYYLRYLDPRNNDQLVDPEVEKAWMPVDLYVGGAEHAVLHLLYSRFWHKVLFDRGHVSTDEPFGRLVNQGMILGEVEITGYKDSDGSWVSAADVEVDGNGPVRRETSAPLQPLRVPPSDVTKVGDRFVLKSQTDVSLDSRAYKMSKSRGNVVNPDDIVKEYGADALRLYEMFMGPLEATKPWSMDGVNGVYNFLGRAWRMIIDDKSDAPALAASVTKVEPTEEQERLMHKTIAAVTRDTADMGFNTAIARMMEFVNFFTKQTIRPHTCMERFVLLLSPYAPHLAEELWNLLGHDTTLAYEPWPTFDEALLKDKTIEVPVQVNGKTRSKIQVAADAAQEELVETAKNDPKVAAHLDGKTINKTIVVPGRMVNFVVS